MQPQAWKHGADWQWPEGRTEGDSGGKKGKGLDKEHVQMAHGRGQQCGNWGELGGRRGRRGQRGKIETTIVE